MVERRSDHYVIDRVKVAAAVVKDEIQRLYQDLYQSEPVQVPSSSFDDVGRIFRGEHPWFLPCDTGYHDIQYTLDVAPASWTGTGVSATDGNP